MTAKVTVFLQHLLPPLSRRSISLKANSSRKIPGVVGTGSHQRNKGECKNTKGGRLERTGRRPLSSDPATILRSALFGSHPKSVHSHIYFHTG